jgi:hypothetical protein
VKMTNGLSWDVTANYAHNQNKLESLYGQSTTYQIGSKFFNTSIEARVGEPYGSIVGYRFRRDSASGQVVLGSNGVPLRALTTSVLGNIQPKWTGGLINTFRYKAFELSGQIDARVGGQLYSATNAWGKYAGILAVTAQRDSGVTTSGVSTAGVPVTRTATAEDYWHGQGYNSGDEANVYDAGFIKLREVRLGWAVPQSLLGRSTYRLNVALVGRNLLTHSNVPNIDPETAFTAGNQQGQEFGQLPATRSLGFQVSVTP